MKDDRIKIRGDKVDDTTVLFDTNEINERIVLETLKEVYNSLEERGYNPINQLVGYIISGDLGYISNYQGSRNKIKKIDRSMLVEVLLRSYLNNEIFRS